MMPNPLVAGFRRFRRLSSRNRSDAPSTSQCVACTNSFRYQRTPRCNCNVPNTCPDCLARWLGQFQYDEMIWTHWVQPNKFNYMDVITRNDDDAAALKHPVVHCPSCRFVFSNKQRLAIGAPAITDAYLRENAAGLKQEYRRTFRGRKIFS